MGRALSRQLTGRAPVVQRLEEHPNLTAVLGVLGQLATIRDDDLPRLAALTELVIAEERGRMDARRGEHPAAVSLSAAPATG